MSGTPPPHMRPSLAATLRPVRVGLREDLEVSRHLFRGVPSYIIRDPMTFQSQRLDLADYEIFVSIDATTPLSEIFDDLVRRRKIGANDEEKFYQFVMSLHRLGFLRLPISDDKLLYRRYQMRQRARRREKLMGFLFLRIPLWNPDAFLDRTIHLARPLFSRGFFVIWILLVVSAGYVAARHWDELLEPLEGVLVARNLPLMWVTLIVLKLFHELGHAYACKHYGGHVPEMGAFLIVFTPCAYMDASTSWGFTRRRQRLVVCCAGMYVEAIIAALAMFFWAATEPSLLRSLVYNVIFLASVVTVLFNINPLMRFDGYYIASDLTEIPNLRPRSSQYLLGLLKRFLLGVSPPPETGEWRLRAILFVYGVAATIYRVFLMIAITAILISKMFVLGIVLGVFFLGGTLLVSVRKLTAYLWYAEETALKRWRAVGLSMLILIGLPAGLAFVPLPSQVQAAALIVAEHETVVRVRTPGFLEQVTVEYGQLVDVGDSLAQLADDACLEEIAQAEANVQASKIRRDAYRIDEPVRVLQEEAGGTVHQRALEEARSKLTDLHILAPSAGRIVECLQDSDTGSFLAKGNPVAAIVTGRWQVRAVLTEDQIVRSAPGGRHGGVSTGGQSVAND